MSPTGTTTKADAQRASLLFSQDQVKRINADLEKRYNSNFDSWKTMVNAGIIPNTNPPQPPAAWSTFTQADGYTYEQLSALPVCSARADIPEDHTQSSVPDVAPIDTINVPHGDTNPVGTSVTGIQLLSMGADPREIGSPGSRWEKREHGGPWGAWRWYQRLS